ncbi:MAG: tetratricopeptide repeat protein [Candidatus Melainabacteria bacterium]|nr:tetratricopeptide repeat protein [Candidatus Melainabacteria bacterium]
MYKWSCGLRLFVVIYSLIIFNLGCLANPYQSTEADKKAEVSRLINQGIKYHSSRNYPLAIQAFSDAYNLDNNNLEVTNNLSITHNNYGKYLAERTDPKGAMTQFRTALYYDINNDIARKNLETQLQTKKVNPKDTTVRLIEAEDERAQSNFFAALGELNEINKIQETPRAFLMIGKIYHVLSLRSIDDKVGFMAKSLKNLDKAQLLEPRNPEPIIAKGDIYVAKGKISRGIDYYKQAIELDPTNGPAQQALVNGWLAAIRVAPSIANNFVGLATAYQLQGNIDQAEKNYRRALQLEPTNQLAVDGIKAIENDKVQMELDLFLNRAIAFQKEGRYDESIDSYIKAVRLAPRNADIHYNVGTSFQAKKDWFQAEKAYRRVLELDPNHKEATLALKALTDDRKETQVSEAFDKAIALQQQGMLAEAISIYLKVAEDKPTDDTLFYNLGTAYQANNEFDKAKESFIRAATLKPEDQTYKDALAFIVNKKADQLLEKGVNAQTNGKYEEAIVSYLELLKINSERADIWYNLGIAYQSIAKPDEALNAYTKAFEINPREQSDAIFFGALILEDKKNITKAMELYEKYIKVAPGGEYFMDARDRLEYIKSQN